MGKIIGVRVRWYFFDMACDLYGVASLDKHKVYILEVKRGEMEDCVKYFSENPDILDGFIHTRDNDKDLILEVWTEEDGWVLVYDWWGTGETTIDDWRDEWVRL